MQVDWFTLTAQIVNFLLLLFILKKLLFERVMRAMQKREQHIADQIERAGNKEKKAESLKQELENKRRDWEEEKDAREKQLKQELDEKRKQWMEKARQEVDARRKDWEEQLENDRQSFEKNFRAEAAQQVFDISRRVLNDLADESMENAMLRCFSDRFDRMDEKETERLSEALEETDRTLTVETRFDLSDSQKESLSELANRKFDRNVRLRTRKDAALIAGISLKAGGWTLDWHVADYLDALREMWRKQLESTASS